MWSIKHVALILLLIGTHSVRAQPNLVLNGDFEDFTACPFAGSFTGGVVTNWNSQYASPDYFNACNEGNYGIPINFGGYQDAGSENNGYIGLATYTSIFVGGNELAKGNLSQPLQAGVKYRIRFRASMADNMRFSTCCIGVVLSSQPPPNPPYISNLSDVELVIDVANYDTTTWFQLDTTYTATGGENKIYIGCFRPEAEMGVTETNANALDGLSSAYFYIDDVEVYEDDTITNIEEGTEKPKVTVWHDAMGRTLVLNGAPVGATATVYDAAGRAVAQGQGNSLMADGLSGFYVVRLTGAKGEVLCIVKIIIP